MCNQARVHEFPRGRGSENGAFFAFHCMGGGGGRGRRLPGISGYLPFCKKIGCVPYIYFFVFSDSVPAWTRADGPRQITLR